MRFYGGRWEIRRLPAVVLALSLSGCGADAPTSSELPPVQPPLPALLDVASLLDYQLVSLGTLGGREFKVSLGAIYRPDFLREVGEAETALVISQFSNHRGSGVVCGFGCWEPGDGAIELDNLSSLGRAVHDRLAETAPEALQAFLAGIATSANAEPGTAVGIPLKLRPESRAEFPVDRLYAVSFQSDAHGPAAAEMLRLGLQQTLRRAAEEEVEVLVIPALTYSWEFAWNASEVLESVYGSVFSSAAEVPGDEIVVLTLYSRWPTPVLETAVQSIEKAWRDSGSGSGAGREPGL